MADFAKIQYVFLIYSTHQLLTSEQRTGAAQRPHVRRPSSTTPPVPFEFFVDKTFL